MMKLKLISLFLASLVFSIGEGRVNYNGYQVLRIDTNQVRAFEALKHLNDQNELDFWRPPSRISNTSDVLLSPAQIQSFKTFLNTVEAPYKVLVDNLGLAIENERVNSVASVRSDMDWTSYHRLETIHNWMDSQAEEYPSLVTIMEVGKSTEGRPLKVMKISSGGSRSDKPAVWLDGGIHAREWISPATVTFMANELIKQSVQNNLTRLVNYMDFYIDPVLNPDGYEFTHQVNRMWRKTRSRSGSISFGPCRGTDPNRNWDHQWGGKGASANQCSDTYRGKMAASEPEVSSIQNFVLERKDQIKLFLTFHSYSQLLLLPWGYDEIRMDDHDELMTVGLKALEALKTVHGTEYMAGNTAEILYPASGGSHDWAKGGAGIKFAYCYELRDTGDNGFLLPSDQIIPSGEETFAGVQSMAQDVIEYYNLKAVV